MQTHLSSHTMHPMHLQASWVEMDERHGELSQQVNSLKASLRRAGAHDEDAYQHDVQDYKKSPELFDRHGDPVRPAESLKAMWPEIGLPPPTDPRLVKCVIHLGMAPEELAFHVSTLNAVSSSSNKTLCMPCDIHWEHCLDVLR